MWKRCVWLAVLAAFSAVCAVDLDSVTACLVREYNLFAQKPHVTPTGDVLECSGFVKVNSCWGRCDSSEIADYKIPFKISNHPVCTYSRVQKRRVRLPNCHPEHPDPYYVVYDALACSCRYCNSKYTSCETLNGWSYLSLNFTIGSSNQTRRERKHPADSHVPSVTRSEGNMIIRPNFVISFWRGKYCCIQLFSWLDTRIGIRI